MLPPARRGDLDALAGSPPGTIVLVDGLFHAALAVGHAEISARLADGWRVWGLASMGAIRAWEMRDVGMRGFGEVYAEFARHLDFRDDEVALLHAPDAPYRAVTEPLVHLRHLLAAEVSAGRLPAPAAAATIATLADLWFGDRTVRRTAEILAHHTGGEVRPLELTLRAALPASQVKTQDLARFFADRPDLAAP